MFPMCRIIIDALILFPKAFSFSNIRFILNFASDPSMFLIASQLSVSHLHSSPFLSILLNPLFLSILLGSFLSYPAAFSFFIWLVKPLFSLPWGKPKGWSFFAWFDSFLLGLAEKWFLSSFLSYPSAWCIWSVSYTHLRAHETFYVMYLISPLVCGSDGPKNCIFLCSSGLFDWLTIVLPLQHKSFNFFVSSAFVLCYDFSQDKSLNFFGCSAFV